MLAARKLDRFVALALDQFLLDIGLGSEDFLAVAVQAEIVVGGGQRVVISAGIHQAADFALGEHDVVGISAQAFAIGGQRLVGFMQLAIGMAGGGQQVIGQRLGGQRLILIDGVLIVPGPAQHRGVIARDVLVVLVLVVQVAEDHQRFVEMAVARQLDGLILRVRRFRRHG